MTFDKDFGELAARSRVPASGGVVLFRLHASNPEVDNARAVAALTSRDDWAGHFAVVTRRPPSAATAAASALA